MNQNKIYVGNLSYSSTNDDLNNFFGEYGAISEIKLITDYEGRSKGFGFITFETEESAQNSLAANGVEFQGRNLKVNIAREQSKDRGGRGGQGGARGGQGGGRGDRRW